MLVQTFQQLCGFIPAEPRRGSQGQGLPGGKSEQGAEGEQPWEDPNTAKLQ